MKEYLKFGDEGSLEGKVKKEPNIERGYTEPCPTCQGYGGWILRPNAYGEGKHFECWCGDCFGNGYLKPGQEPYSIKYKRIKDIFKNHIKVTNQIMGYAHNRGICELTNPDLLNHPDLETALILAVDGWWQFNFGGYVERIPNEPLKFRVKVYTD